MATAKPITWTVSDIIQWFKRGELVINDTFQRHSVWTPQAKTYLIDSMLKELPLPKLYIRTKIDPKTQTSVREVVDGQQRVRAFVEFADGRLRLTKRSEEFSGNTYLTLDDELQQRFLGYVVTVEQLLNASDDDVIDIFARLNSYTVSLNAAEKRHAKYQTNFKFAVRKASVQFRWFIEKYEVFTTKLRFRMADDVFMAYVYGVLMEGVTDGGEANVNRLYDRQDDDTFLESIDKKITGRMQKAFRFLDTQLGTVLNGPLSRHYQLLIIIAAYAHHEFGIPSGQIADMPERKALADKDSICERLAAISEAIESEKPPKRFREFVDASGQRPERIASRRVRFSVLVDALQK